jgi:hypothetical protein
MARGRMFALSLGIILAATVIAVVAVTTVGSYSDSGESVSAAPTQARETIYRPQHLLLY